MVLKLFFNPEYSFKAEDKTNKWTQHHEDGAALAKCTFLQ